MNWRGIRIGTLYLTFIALPLVVVAHTRGGLSIPSGVLRTLAVAGLVLAGALVFIPGRDAAGHVTQDRGRRLLAMAIVCMSGALVAAGDLQPLLTLGALLLAATSLRSGSRERE
ncbi:MAG TPA: hypothetical protein VFV33_17690 [Gemmatimonadaceae bacterium]|nr:hypothetical protein [Gemmatimonadaceae bacterium]